MASFLSPSCPKSSVGHDGEYVQTIMTLLIRSYGRIYQRVLKPFLNSERVFDFHGGIEFQLLLASALDVFVHLKVYLYR
jgi:hypothetical protein